MFAPCVHATIVYSCCISVLLLQSLYLFYENSASKHSKTTHKHAPSTGKHTQHKRHYKMTTDNDNFQDREAWLTECASLMMDELILPTTAPGTPPPPVRLSVGFASSRAASALACCYKREVSSDSVNEIFVSPVSADSVQILAAVAHELIHAVDDCASGHRGYFARAARAIGLEGKLTATTPGEQLTAKLQEYVQLFGEIPHAALNLARRPKQSTRMLKVKCSDASCGFTFRTSAKWVSQLDADSACPLCATQDLLINA